MQSVTPLCVSVLNLKQRPLVIRLMGVVSIYSSPSSKSLTYSDIKRNLVNIWLTQLIFCFFWFQKLYSQYQRYCSKGSRDAALASGFAECPGGDFQKSESGTTFHCLPICISTYRFGPSWSKVTPQLPDKLSESKIAANSSGIKITCSQVGHKFKKRESRF